jgi:protein TonB
VPLLVVGAISVVMLMAGAAAAILIVMANSGAFSPVPPIRDTPPVAQVPPPDAPPEPEAVVDTPPPGRPGGSPAPRSTGGREADAPLKSAGAERGAAAGRSRRDTAADEPVERAVRVGGQIKQPTRIRNVQPIYPQIARSARVQGVVIIEATIDPGGKVRDTRLLRSIPLLDQAALDAVRKWEYEPTLLNGVAVPVIMTVTVNFTLQ